MKPKKLFVRVPVTTKNQWAYVGDIDVARLTPAVLSQLYESNFGQEKGNFYRPVNIEVGKHVDVTELLATANGLLDQCRSALLACGKPGEEIWNGMDNLGLTDFIENFSRGQIGLANEALRQILYCLMGVTAASAAELQELRKQSSGMTHALDGMDLTLRESDNITNEFYLQWATAIAEINAAVDLLQVAESELDQALEQIEQKRTRWKRSLCSDLDPLQGALNFLDRSENSFLVRAFLVLRESSSQVEPQTLLDEATRWISVCRGAEKNAISEWKTLLQAKDRVLSLKTEVDKVCGELEHATQQLQDTKRRFPKGTALPHEVPSALVSKKEYDRADQTLRDPRWSKLNALRRIESKIVSVLAFLDKPPAFSEEVDRVLTQAEQYVRQLTARQEKQEQVVEREKAPTANQRRAQELYEMVLCVAYILTGQNPNPMSGSNPRAMLRVIQHHGLCDAEEVTLFRETLAQMIKHPSCCEALAESRLVSERYKMSQRLWLSYRVRTRFAQNRLKLTLAAGKTALQLMKKYGLSEESIRHAHKLRLEEQKKASSNARLSAGQEITS